MKLPTSRAPEKSPVKGKRLRTRSKLIEAAALVIGEVGYDRASLEQIAARAGMTRGAIYGNFKNKEELFLELVALHWGPILPPPGPPRSLALQMRALGEAVAAAAIERRPYAVAASAFQLYVLTNESMRLRIASQNARIYAELATMLETKTDAADLPMPANRLVRVLDALTTGLLFTYFQTPELIDRDTIVAAFEALGRLPANSTRWT